jgi:hypothetical protein
MTLSNVTSKELRRVCKMDVQEIFSAFTMSSISGYIQLAILIHTTAFKSLVYYIAVTPLIPINTTFLYVIVSAIPAFELSPV